MRFKSIKLVVDENIPREVVVKLRSMGFKEVYWIAEQKSGIKDPEVWRIAAEKQAILITRDKKFSTQLELDDLLYGPPVIEYWSQGFATGELRDGNLMAEIVYWYFDFGCHDGKEHANLSISGTVNTRRDVWGKEKSRRKRLL